MKRLARRIIRSFTTRALSTADYYHTISRLEEEIRRAHTFNHRESALHAGNQPNPQYTPWGRLIPDLSKLTDQYYVKRKLDLLNLFKPECPSSKLVKYKRFGSSNDGGYPLIQDLKSDDVLLSAGLAQNIDFEIEVSRHVREVVMLDPTATDLYVPKGNFSLHIAPLVPAKRTTSGLTLENLMELSQGKDYILKCDIEGNEWEIFATTTEGTLEKFRQIAVEFHGLDFPWSLEHEGLQVQAMRNLLSTHALVSVQPNNTGRWTNFGSFSIPETAEFLFIRRKSYMIKEGFDNRIRECLAVNDTALPEIDALSLFR